ncbi:uncharacterized protein LOC143240822 isoform X1 [Tachypleus tridentatus]|uniref:uncharacterized protein LOC143240822 isoform X1 n=1 Tax=Tachypleus tridentatus TaxID=6853 RepID=UPI003FD4BB2B
MFLLRISMNGATWWWALIFIYLIECFTVTSGNRCLQDSRWFQNQMLSEEESKKNGAKVEIIKLYSSKSAQDCVRECCEKTYGDCIVSSYIQNQSVVTCYHFQCSPVTHCSLQPSNSAESVIFLTESVKEGLGQNELLATASKKETDLSKHLEGSQGDGKFSKPRKGVKDCLSESNNSFSEDCVEYLSFTTFFNKTKNSVQPRKGVSLYPKKDIFQNNQTENKEAENNGKNYNKIATVNLKNDSGVFNYQNKMKQLDILDETKELLSSNYTTEELGLMTTPTDSIDFQNHKQNMIVTTAKNMVPVDNIIEHTAEENPVLETSVIAHVMRNSTFSGETRTNRTSTEETTDLKEPKLKPSQNRKDFFSENYKIHIKNETIQTTPPHKNKPIQATPPYKHEQDSGEISNKYAKVAGHHKVLSLQDHNVHVKAGKKIPGNYSLNLFTDDKTNQTYVFKTVMTAFQETTSNNEDSQPKISPTVATVTVYKNNNVSEHAARVHNVAKKVFSDRIYAEYAHTKNSSDDRTSSPEQPTSPLYINYVNIFVKPTPISFTDKPASIPVTFHSTSRPQGNTVRIGRVKQNDMSTTEHYLKHNNLEKIHTSTAPSKSKVPRDSVFRTYDPSSVHLIIALVLGLLLLFTVLGLIGKRIYDTWQRRHYHRMDYLVEDFYNN